MLKQLRERTKVILWIVVVAFVVSIFAVWGMNLRTGDSAQQGSDEVAGTVNGIEISWRDYNQVTNELYNQMKAQRGQDYEPNENERRMLNEQAWELSVRNILLKEEISKLEIVVTDEELVTFLRTNPHPSLQQVFTSEDGSFDYRAYLDALADPEVDWTELERWGRAVLPEMKLEALLSAQIHVTDSEILERFRKENTEVMARYVEIPYVEADSAFAPAEEEIIAMYEESEDEYQEFEKRSIRVIEIGKTPTAADEREVQERMLEIRNEILSGGDFAEAAQDNSDDQMSAVKGGDLGFFAKGQMVPAFEEAAFALEAGEVSGLVKTDYGYHIIKLEERTVEEGEEKIRARHILMRVEPGYETIDSLRTLLRDLSDEIKESGFEQAASKMNLEVKNPDPFIKGTFIPGMGYLPRVVNFTFTNKTGSVSMPIETENSVYMVKITGVTPERKKPLEEVRPLIVDSIRREWGENETRKLAESIRQEALTSGDLDAAALARELTIATTTYFKVGESVPGIGMNTAFAVAAHLLGQDELSAPIKGRRGYYLIIVTDRRHPDMAEFAGLRAEINGRLRNEMASKFLAGWYDVIRQNADLADFRERTLD
jgi:peptidyl-prolyl cis-trans isomerase D